MSTWSLSLGAAAVISAVSSVAQAQPPARQHSGGGAGSPGGSNGLGGALLVHRDPAADAIQLGRIRMSKGDCAGALEAFDAALRTSVDVTVHRDRGLCHEQLAQPFPAMDDFRIYLTALPDAPDSEDIRNRLNQIEIANGFGGTGTGGTSAPGATQANGTTKSTADHEDPFAIDPNDPNASAKANNPEVVAGSGDRSRAGNYDQEIALNDRYDEAEASPLRRGTGLTFGVYGRGYAGSSNGMSGYGTGATLRGSISRVSTIYGEIGYAAYRSNGDASTSVQEGGLSVGLGYEARIRLDEFASNAIILAGTLSYERVTDSNQVSRPVYNILDPRVKAGYRHVFGPGFGIEIAAEASNPIVFVTGSTNVTYFGGTLALLVGF